MTVWLFSSCLPWLTLLTGVSWRVRHVLIQWLYHIAETCQWRLDQKNVHPACTSSRPDGDTSSPLTIARNRCERVQASPGNVDDVWPTQAHWTVPPSPSHWFSPLYTHQLASGVHSTWIYSEATDMFYTDQYSTFASSCNLWMVLISGRMSLLLIGAQLLTIN